MWDGVGEGWWGGDDDPKTHTLTHTLFTTPKLQGAIVHRDLKPGNLMISGSQYVPRPRLVSDVGVVKLADFGLSKSLPKADKHAGYDLDSKFKLTGE